jgi:hypothetical protein
MEQSDLAQNHLYNVKTEWQEPHSGQNTWEDCVTEQASATPLKSSSVEGFCRKNDVRKRNPSQFLLLIVQFQKVETRILLRLGHHLF